MLTDLIKIAKSATLYLGSCRLRALLDHGVLGLGGLHHHDGVMVEPLDDVLMHDILAGSALPKRNKI